MFSDALSLSDPSIWTLLLFLNALPFVCLGLFLAWKNPGIVFGLFLTIPFFKGAIAEYLPVDLTAALLALLLLPILQLAINPSRYHLRFSALLVWVLLLVVVVAGSFVASFRQVSLPHIQPVPFFLNYFLLLWIPGLAAFRVIGDRRSTYQMLHTIASVGLLTILFGLLGLGTLGELDRVQALGSNTIGTARSALWAPLVLVPLYWGKTAMRLPLVMLTGLALFVAVSSGSRGPVVFFFLAVGTFTIFRLTRAGMVKYVLSVAVSGVIVALASTSDTVKHFIPSQSLDRIGGFFDNLVGTVTGRSADWDTSTVARFQLWDIAREMFSDHPIIGYGTGTFGPYAASRGLEGYDDGPHNLVFHIASELGVVGMLTLGVLLLVLLQKALRPSTYPAFIAISGLFVLRMYESLVGTGVYDRQTWLLVALMLAVPIVSPVSQVAEVEVVNRWRRQTGVQKRRVRRTPPELKPAPNT